MNTYRMDPAKRPGIERALTRRVGRPSPIRTEAELTYYDTFDWRIFRASGTLVTIRSGAYDAEWRTIENPDGVRWRSRRVPGFARDLPAEAPREELRAVIKARRLLPVVRTEERVRVWHLKDSRARCVARLTLRYGQARAPRSSTMKPLPPTLRIETMRDGERGMRRAQRILEEELGLERCRETDVELALSAIGRKPADYTSRLAVALDPRMRADRAVLAILTALNGTMRRNEQGIRRNVDPEFLHDFRVACRRTRAALTQLKGVLRAETVTRFRREFQSMGKATGPTRDLDVYLLGMPSYKADLPPDVRDDLAPLQAYLERRRDVAHAGLVAVLDGVWYRNTVRDWGRFLASPLPEGGSGPDSREPVKDVAAQRIEKAHRRVMDHGSAITAESPASDLHTLRINCKKLRYLLQFYQSLYPPSAISRPIDELKALQDTLGDLNDLEIQEQALRRFALEMAEETAAPPETLLAVGRLVERLRLRRDDMRARFDLLFSRFTDPASRKRFERLARP